MREPSARKKKPKNRPSTFPLIRSPRTRAPALQKPRHPPRVFRRDKVLPAVVLPTHTPAPKLLPLDLEHGNDATAGPRAELPPGRHEALETDHPRALLELEEQRGERLVQRRRESLIVDQDDVGGL